MENVNISLKPLNDYKWIIPKEKDMQVPGVIYASEKMLPNILQDNALEQVVNVAKLPGIVMHSLAMPDVHWGYGAPIGGVGAFDTEKGVIVPGFIGYDINCGVRLIRSSLPKEIVTNKLQELINELFINIPSGVGSTGKLKLKKKELANVIVEGAGWAVKNGYGGESDIENIEEYGCMKGVNPEAIGNKASERGLHQLGTLGSGNHFLEIQQVKEIYDENIAKTLGLYAGQITIMVHTGSRGFGYQICDDYLALFKKASDKYGIVLPDRQLACAPFNSKEGKRYLSAMKAAANYAFANRQIISHYIRETFLNVLNVSRAQAGFAVVYDVCHNIGKFENHNVNGQKKTLFVHRKGATRAFPREHPEIPAAYKHVGQPVIIPGTMGTSSYVLAGTEKAMEETWGSTCHGAGRIMSRHKAIKESKGRFIDKELAKKGILVQAKSRQSLAEEMPEAYKDIDEVIRTVEGAGLSKKVAKMVPIAVIKG